MGGSERGEYRPVFAGWDQAPKTYDSSTGWWREGQYPILELLSRSTMTLYRTSYSCSPKVTMIADRSVCQAWRYAFTSIPSLSFSTGDGKRYAEGSFQSKNILIKGFLDWKNLPGGPKTNTPPRTKLGNGSFWLYWSPGNRDEESDSTTPGVRLLRWPGNEVPI